MSPPIDLTLIPFGLREEDYVFVDVSLVKRGRKCGCICPSCKTPLIARQGGKNQWHFAHASRSVYEQTVKECEYSFFVSVRLMARQVIGSSLEIKLPAYEEIASLFIEETGDYLEEKFNVTNEQIVRIENIEIEKEFCGIPVDVYGKVYGYPFILYFTHPGREIAIELKSLKAEKCGIVEVSLGETYSLFVSDRSINQSYLEKLRLFLAENVRSKQWIFHPRFRDIQALAELALEARREELLKQSNEEWNSRPNIELYPDSELGEKTRKEVNRHEVKYQCQMCGTPWVGVEPGYSSCPKCKTHLYGKPIS